MSLRLRLPGLVSVVALPRLAIVAAALAAALDWRSPLLASHRGVALTALIAAPSLMIVLELWLRRSTRLGPRRWLAGSIMLIAAAALIVTLVLETRFQWQRSFVLAADPAELERLGHHFIVGYRDPAELRLLLERRAIGGVFVGARNVEGMSGEAVRDEIASWQELRRRQGMLPLLIATDQEGGSVSRLSPPLPRQPSLASVAKAAFLDEGGMAAAVHGYAVAQGRGLAGLGINVNFAPVIDIDRQVVNPGDVHTRISERAVGSNPNRVSLIGLHYCLGLAASGVRCTLKHFPGLGGVFEDTHLETGYLRTPLAALEAADLVPFKRLMRQPGVLTMLSHARLTALDPEHPVSFSETVVDGLVRRDWGHSGVLVTDDFSMYAVYSSREGVGGASIAALAAGVDLILIAYDPALYYPAMAAALAGARAGRLPTDRLESSRRRLRAVSINP